MISYVFGIWLIGSGFLPKMAKVKAQTNITHSQMVAEKNPDKQKKKTKKTKTKQKQTN